MAELGFLARRAGGLGLALLLAAPGCSWLVSEDPGPLGCAVGGALGPPSCDVGFRCEQGSCERCSGLEQCGDGVDNDCNGRIDEGCTGQAGAPGDAGR